MITNDAWKAVAIGPALKVTKLEAARRQLDTAIELWFHNGDPISIHALTFAAHEIIYRIYRNSGGSDLLFDTSRVKDEYRAMFAKALKESANFFKHAERDARPNEETFFNPAKNVLFVGVCIAGLQRMKEPLNDVEKAFLFWVYVHIPNWFVQDVGDQGIPVDTINQIRGMPMDGFLEAFCEIIRRRRSAGEIVD